MNERLLREIFLSFEPQAVVHLAARTDTDILDLNGDLAEYIHNTAGTHTVLWCINQTKSVKRAIITSSMFVCKPGYMPAHERDFSPFTLYGKSKMLAEEMTHEADLICSWTIIRPQTLWGPWSLRYTKGFLNILKRGLYVHPDARNVKRAYGYVGNVIWQIMRILEAPEQQINKRTLYVGDTPVNLMDWANQVSLEMTDKPVRVVPALFVRSAAWMGDLLKMVNVGFPMTSTRYKSMVQDYLTPIHITHELLGSPPVPIDEGIREFVKWNDHFVKGTKIQRNRGTPPAHIRMQRSYTR
jgi:nucleoside-diphosphate-sugar epimerase